MSVPRYIVDRQELLAVATADALGDRQPGDVEVVKFTDHVAAVEAAELKGLRQYEEGCKVGQRDMLAKCLAAIDGLTAGRERMEYDEGRADQVAAHNAYIDCVVDVINALCALLPEGSES